MVGCGDDMNEVALCDARSNLKERAARRCSRVIRRHGFNTAATENPRLGIDGMAGRTKGSG